jgi:hypothetical protein
VTIRTREIYHSANGDRWLLALFAVELNQVEGVQEDMSVLAAVAQPVEARHAPDTRDRLTIDKTRARLEREYGARDQWTHTAVITG